MREVKLFMIRIRFAPHLVLILFSALLINVLCNNLFHPSSCSAEEVFKSPNENTAWDSKLGFNFRSYPLGAQATATLGYDFLLWDRSTSPKTVWHYGYLRGALNFATSAVVNRVGFELQAFPISIFGISVGYDWGLRNYTPKWLDCQTYECNGRIDRKFIKGNLFGAYHSLVFAGTVRYEELRAYHTSKQFFDETTLLVGRNAGEHLLTLNPVLVYAIDDVWKAGAMSLYSRAMDTGDFSHLYGPLVTWTHDSILTVAGGVGLNRSPVVQSGWAAFLVVSYNLQPSLAISEVASRGASESQAR